jgi:hypothetical protein
MRPAIFGYYDRFSVIFFSIKPDGRVQLKKRSIAHAPPNKAFIQSDSPQQVAKAFTAHSTELRRFQTPGIHPAN